jgi:hypothetical protein
MTKFIYTFPIPTKNRASLTCVWTETGNPRQPLACRWVARDPAQHSPTAADPATTELLFA